MRVEGLRGLSFTGSIIDSHMHWGHWSRNNNPENLVFFNNDYLDAFVRSPLDVTVQGKKQQDNIEKVLISNLDCFVNGGIKDEISGNKEMLDFCNSNPKYFALASCQPSKTEGKAVAINNLLNENPGKFVGLKLHPRNFNLSAEHPSYRPYLQLAERYKLPCLFHSDINLNTTPENIDKISSPESIHKLAKKFPNVPVIMAHMGAGDAKSHQNAIDVLLKSIDKNDSKLYVDISWVDWGQDGLSSPEKPSIVKLIKELDKRNATDRILFGTDAPLGCFGESLKGGLSSREAYEKTVGDIKTVIKQNFGEKADELIDKIFYKNADELFFKKEWAVPKNIAKNKTSVGKAVAMAIGALLVLTGLSYLIKSFKSSDNSNKIVKR